MKPLGGLGEETWATMHFGMLITPGAISPLHQTLSVQ